MSEDLHEKRRTQEDVVWEEVEEHMRSWDSTRRRVDSLTEKMWQLNQSNETKTKNLEDDFEDLAARAKDFESKDEDNPRAWIERQKRRTFQLFLRCCEGVALCKDPK